MTEAEKKIRDIEHLRKLINSPGWKIVKDVMTAEILRAAYALAENAPLPIEQIHFQRGAMWAARRCVDVPERLVQVLESEATLLKAQEALESKEKK